LTIKNEGEHMNGIPRQNEIQSSHIPHAPASGVARTITAARERFARGEVDRITISLKGIEDPDELHYEIARAYDQRWDD
jgi:hypothetical protein